MNQMSDDANELRIRGQSLQGLDLVLLGSQDNIGDG
jgi:hypothetical protein